MRLYSFLTKRLWRSTLFEKQIQTAVGHLRRDRTTLVIAYKLSTIECAARISILDAGRLVGEGPHTELLKNNRICAALYRSQTRSPTN